MARIEVGGEADQSRRAGWHRVIMPEARPMDDVPYHHLGAPGQKYLVLDESVVVGSPVYVALRRINYVPPERPRWLDPHEHTCNSFYVFVGDGEDLTGLAAIAQIGERQIAVASPVAVLIPPRVLHHYWYTGGSGWYVQITLSPSYAASLVPMVEMESGGAVVEDERDVARGACREVGGWRLVDGERFASPGVRVGVLESPGDDGLVDRDGAGGVCLDILVGQGGEPTTWRVDCHGEVATLESPAAVLHVGEAVAPRCVEGDGLVIRVAPDAGWDDGGVGAGVAQR